MQNLGNTIAAFVIRSLNITTESRRRWKVHSGTASGQKVLKLAVIDNVGWAVAFRNPFHKMGTANP